MNKDNINFLPSVYGLRRIKEELKAIYGWYKDTETAGKRKSLLPHGILFYGEPGCGKTLLMREFSKEFDCPIFVIEGNELDVQEEVIKTYEKAAKEEMAIVIIDELDRLIDRDDKLIRLFQAKLDGFKENFGTLTLATANDENMIPEPLKREGRFDRRFSVELNEEEEVKEAIEGFLATAGIGLSEDEVLELVDSFRFKAASQIRASINMASLRYGDACTMDNIIDSSYFLDWGSLPKKEDLNVPWRHAIHEAGHAAFTHYFSHHFRYGRIYFTQSGGFTTLRAIERRDSVAKLSDNIRISLAGLIAEEVVLGKHDFGSCRDLDQAHYVADRLVNRQGLAGVDRYCDKLSERANQMSQRKIKRFEGASERFIRRQYRIAKRLMRRKRKDIVRLASFLQTNKRASRTEIAEILG